MEYELYLRDEAFEFLRGQRPAGRETLLGFLRGLRKDPFRYAVLFWADHPAKEIKVVELRLADH